MLRDGRSNEGEEAKRKSYKSRERRGGETVRNEIERENACVYVDTCCIERGVDRGKEIETGVTKNR